MSAANGNGWFGKLAATWRKVPRGLLSMLGAKAEAIVAELSEASHE
jgi:hypothetical protein